MSRNPTELLTDLASEVVGGRVLVVSDEMLGPKEDLLSQSGAGWKTRWRHSPGHDWAIVSLGLPGIDSHIVVDTTGFAGRHPTHISVESIHLAETPDIVELVRDPGRWSEIVSRSPLAADRPNTFPVEFTAPSTHLRLVTYPGGGVAGLRVFGDPTPPDGLLDGKTEIDLAALCSGAGVVDCSGPNLSPPSGMLSDGGDRC